MTDVTTRFLDRLIGSRTPGLQYVVVDASAVRLNYAAGWARIRDRVPLEQGTSMMAYSMTKTITAAAVLQLVALGRVGLDDPVSRFVNVDYGDDVTIRRLLSHTAGVASPIPLSWVHLAERHSGFDEPAALADALRRHGRLRATPGRRFRYSNLGYWLLGPVVERAAGEPYTTYVEQRLLRPLGIAQQDLGFGIPDLTRHASGYLEKYSLFNLLKGFLLDPAYIGGYEGSWLRINTHYLNGLAFGGLVGTAAAWGAFLQDQLRPASAVLPPEARRLFYEQQQTSTGRPIPMTLGWHVGQLDGSLFYFKEGGGGGFHTMMRLYPERGIGTVLLANATRFDVSRALDALDRLELLTPGG